jgi:hypothetical protein
MTQEQCETNDRNWKIWGEQFGWTLLGVANNRHATFVNSHNKSIAIDGHLRRIQINACKRTAF